MLVALCVLTRTFRVGSGAMVLPAASAFLAPLWMCHFGDKPRAVLLPKAESAGFMVLLPVRADTVNEPNTTAASARSLYTSGDHRSDPVRAEGKSADDQPMPLDHRSDFVRAEGKSADGQQFAAKEPPRAADTLASSRTSDRTHQARSGEVSEQVPQARMGAGIHDSTLLRYAIAIFNLGAISMIVLFMLNNPGEASLRIPPRYDPANERNYSFRIYSNDA